MFATFGLYNIQLKQVVECRHRRYLGTLTLYANTHVVYSKVANCKILQPLRIYLDQDNNSQPKPYCI